MSWSDRYSTWAATAPAARPGCRARPAPAPPSRPGAARAGPGRWTAALQPGEAGRACGRYWRASAWISQRGLMRTPFTSSAAVLLDCRPSRRRSALRVRPAMPCGSATTAGVPSGAVTAAATRKPSGRRLVTQGMRPSSTPVVAILARRDLQRLDAAENFMALDSAVAPASSPRSSGPVQSRASAWFGLCSRYSMKTRWPQATKAAATECSASRDTASMASPASLPSRPPWLAGTPSRNTPASASLGRTEAGSSAPSSSAWAWASSQSRSSAGSQERAPVSRLRRRHCLGLQA